MIRSSLAWTFILVSGIIAGSCGRHATERDAQIFRYNEPAGISSLDPAFARNLSNIWAVSQLFNGLVQLDDQLNVQPCIARHWEVEEEGTLYRFYLRNDVYFHHDTSFSGRKGRKLTASDFIFSFNRIIDPETSSPGAWVFNEVVRLQDGSLDIWAPEDTILEISLKRPFPPFLGILSMPYCAAVNPEAVEAFGQDFRKHPVGTGPFRFKFLKEGVKLVLRRNPAYFEYDGENQLPYLEAISISFIIDKQAAFLEFIKGNLDFMSGIDPSYKDELLSPEGKLNPQYSSNVRLITQPYLNTEYLGFMLDPENLPESSTNIADKRIRQAINYGFDRGKMIRYLRNNIGTPGTGGFIPQGLPGFDKNGRIGYDYQPDRVRELLREAGYPGGKGLAPITLSTTSEYIDLCKYIQHELEQFGVNIRLDVSPPAAIKEMKAQARLPFFRGSWIADYPDAENYLSLFLSDNFCPAGPNYFHFSSREADALYAEAMSVTDDRKRAALYHKMDSIVMSESPAVVLYYDQVLRFVSSKVTGLGSNPINQLTLKQVHKITAQN